MQPRILFTSFLVLIFVDGLLVVYRLSQAPMFFGQPQSRNYIFNLLGISAVYAAALFWMRRNHSRLRPHVIQFGLWYGLVTGCMEIANILIEDGVPFTVTSKFFALGTMLLLFSLWGVAGFVVAGRTRSATSGVLAAVAASAFCMLVGVTAGIVLELFVLPGKPEVVATWNEYLRSGWTDPAVFRIANVLDSAFTHLALAPIIASVFGAVGAAMAKLAWSVRTPAVRGE